MVSIKIGAEGCNYPIIGFSVISTNLFYFQEPAFAESIHPKNAQTTEHIRIP